MNLCFASFYLMGFLYGNTIYYLNLNKVSEMYDFWILNIYKSSYLKIAFCVVLWYILSLWEMFYKALLCTVEKIFIVITHTKMMDLLTNIITLSGIFAGLWSIKLSLKFSMTYFVFGFIQNVRIFNWSNFFIILLIIFLISNLIFLLLGHFT